MPSPFRLGRAAFEAYARRLDLDELALDPGDVNAHVETKGASLASWAWAGPTIGYARLTVIETAAGFRVANWAAFPRFDCVAPMCQAELIEVKGRLFLLVLDALALPGEDRARTALRTLGAGLEAVKPVVTRPTWAQDFITEDAIWSRSNSEAALDEAVGVFSAYMAASTTWLLEGAVDGRAGERRALYARMRKRFLAHEPSRPFMVKTFGAAWSERYTAGFLFPERVTEATLVGSRTRLCAGEKRAAAMAPSAATKRVAATA
ncbi:MAG: hypothetical protein AAGA56_27735 [Myxococcota bacterium]